jgi:hypothetical protein
MQGELQAVIREKIIQGLEFEVPALTRREVQAAVKRWLKI